MSSLSFNSIKIYFEPEKIFIMLKVETLSDFWLQQGTPFGDFRLGLHKKYGTEKMIPYFLAVPLYTKNNVRNFVRYFSLKYNRTVTSPSLLLAFTPSLGQ